jgi:hypothetical protein
VLEQPRSYEMPLQLQLQLLVLLDVAWQLHSRQHMHMNTVLLTLSPICKT